MQSETAGARGTKPGFSAGVLVAVLISFAVFLFGFVGYQGLLSLVLLLVGLWTLVAALAIVRAQERMYYASWGVVLAILSLTYYVSLRYAFGAVLVAVVALVIISAYGNRGQKTQPAPAAAPQR